MKLANIAILALKGCDLETKRRIASVAGGVSVATVNRWIANNDDNLTKAAVLEILLEKTGLTREQILERDTHGSLSSGHSG